MWIEPADQAPMAGRSRNVEYVIQKPNLDWLDRLKGHRGEHWALDDFIEAAFALLVDFTYPSPNALVPGTLQDSSSDKTSTGQVMTEQGLRVPIHRV